MFIVVSLDYIEVVQQLEFVDWDVKTITAGDYTVEFKIDRETHLRWQKRFYDTRNPMSENAQFKLYLETELEERVNNMPDQGYDRPEKRDYRKKLASVTFAYENQEVIEWLLERGTLVSSCEWQKLEDLNR